MIAGIYFYVSVSWDLTFTRNFTDLYVLKPNPSASLARICANMKSEDYWQFDGHGTRETILRSTSQFQFNRISTLSCMHSIKSKINAQISSFFLIFEQ